MNKEPVLLSAELKLYARPMAENHRKQRINVSRNPTNANHFNLVDTIGPTTERIRRQLDPQLKRAYVKRFVEAVKGEKGRY